MAVRDWTTLTAWGLGREAFAGALARRCAPPVAAMEIRGMPDSPAFPYLKADLSAAKDYFAPRALRRVDAFGKIALLLAAALLRDRTAKEREAMGLIVATGFGSFTTNMEFLDTALEGGHGAASPMVFSSTVHNSAMAAAAIQFGIRGPSLTVSMFEHSVPGALMLAELWLARRACPEVLLLAADDVPSLSAYRRARTGDAPDPLRPGTMSAEGGAAFMFAAGDGPSLGRSEARADAIYRSAEPATNAHAYGRTCMAPAFELAAACHDLGNAAAPGRAIALEFPGQPRWLLKHSP